LIERGFADFHARGGFSNVESGRQMLARLGELLRRDDSLPTTATPPFLCGL
jgi:hypothetical protein